MNIRAYNKSEDEDKLMTMLKDEGEEWSCYSNDNVSPKYRLALENSITYVAYEGACLCGFARAINDCDFYLYVCDLLVKTEFRGKNIGRKLMAYLNDTYPDLIVYVMSDVDEYYVKQGYKREGSIFEVKKTINKTKSP